MYKHGILSFYTVLIIAIYNFSALCYKQIIVALSYILVLTFYNIRAFYSSVLLLSDSYQLRETRGLNFLSRPVRVETNCMLHSFYSDLPTAKFNAGISSLRFFIPHLYSLLSFTHFTSSDKLCTPNVAIISILEVAIVNLPCKCIVEL